MPTTFTDIATGNYVASPLGVAGNELFTAATAATDFELILPDINRNC